MHSVASAIESITRLSSSPSVSRLAKAFADAGYELALVGGPVRDAFLGHDVHDLDFTTNAVPDDIIRIVEPISEAHWDIGRDFGTIGAQIAGDKVEITTYRADHYDGQTRKPEVAFGQSLDEDLIRRDFRVNAMAVRLPELVLVDPSGGVEDLMAGVLRAPTSAEVSFNEDPLRMMRAARFVSQLGFHLDEETEWAMTELAPAIEKISAERVNEELCKLLLTDKPRAGIESQASSCLKFLPCVSRLMNTITTRMFTSTASPCSNRPSTSNKNATLANRQTSHCAWRPSCMTLGSPPPAIWNLAGL
jgi:poly(A) polymerase